MLELAAARSSIEPVREGPPCPKCQGMTQIIGELTLAGLTYEYFSCRLCRHVADTRPRLG